MEIVTEASALKNTLGRLRPRRKYKSMKEPFITATAGGSTLVLTGTLDASASMNVLVNEGGSTSIPLEMAIRLLGTYQKGVRVTVRAEPGAVYFDRVRFLIG